MLAAPSAVFRQMLAAASVAFQRMLAAASVAFRQMLAASGAPCSPPRPRLPADARRRICRLPADAAASVAFQQMPRAPSVVFRQTLLHRIKQTPARKHLARGRILW